MRFLAWNTVGRRVKLTCRLADYLNDLNGWRTGFPTIYTSHTIGFIYFFTDWLTIRPEIRYDRTWGDININAYDLGTRKDQLNVAADIILRF